MRIRQGDGLELTYCANIHPGETLDEVEENIRTYAAAVKKQAAPDTSMGIGLRLSNRAAEELTGNEAGLEGFCSLLENHGLYAFTINGFPYGNFHRQRVKDEVYKPDWRTAERRIYTERLADILARLLPAGVEGSISTSPISYKPWLENQDARDDALRAGSGHLSEIAFRLFEQRERSGQLIHIGIEPEPDCLIENTAETISFFEEWLWTHGARRLTREQGLTSTQAEDILREHIRLCYDTCHFAVEFESPREALTAFAQAGVRLSKIQISAALRVPLGEPGAADRQATRNALVEALEPFAESTYLHQVVARAPDGTLHRYRDLPHALPFLVNEKAEEWRIHYHVPVFIDRFPHFYSTQADIEATLTQVLQEASCSHLEIETYTWEVLPDPLKTDIVPSIVREYAWVLDCIEQAA
ncbi:MAG: xylose isomerase [Bacteroidetes bacterium SB0662_bin_6]|nr:xylose isomerase [Bacteroidetes bacterium SB0668_bin_1]MYE04077.1 xylose isomerase [Bacteroidetes bacterium SB0662_bin_6]